MSDSVSDERRRFRRIDFDARIHLFQGERSWPVELYDMSFKGLLVECPPDWDGDPEQPFIADVELSEDAHIQMEVHLARRQDDQLGFVCRHIDLDSMMHLRRLVDLNLGEERLLERELSIFGQDS